MLNLNFYFTHAVFLRGNILFLKIIFCEKIKLIINQTGLNQIKNKCNFDYAVINYNNDTLLWCILPYKSSKSCMNIIQQK